MNDMQAYELKKKNEDWDRNTLRQFAPSDKWVDIISGCLKYKAEDRYQSVKEIIDQLGFIVRKNRSRVPLNESSIWKLRIMNGEEIGRKYNLTKLAQNQRKEVLTVGWFNKDAPFVNDIGIPEYFTEYISNYHATLQYDAATNHWIIKDGQHREKDGKKGWYLSTNGVLVQGKRISKEGSELYPDDIITIGDTTLKVIVDNKQG